jgi:hypothetical protein
MTAGPSIERRLLTGDHARGDQCHAPREYGSPTTSPIAKMVDWPFACADRPDEALLG